MTTISANKTAGLVLNPASYTNPVVIEAGVIISNTGDHDAIAGSGSIGLFIVQNAGTISAPGANADGVYLSPAGSVTNAASAVISGGFEGVIVFRGTGTVVNEGSIAGTGSGGRGVYLGTGGSVTNAASASLTGGYYGVFISGAAALINDGSIANTGVSGKAVVQSGGVVSNGASGTIVGVDRGIYIFGAAATVANAGSVVATGSRGIGVDLHSGGTLSNGERAWVTGVIDGVYIAGGAVTNATSASIAGEVGVALGGGADQVFNDGSIAGSIGSGVSLNSAGSVTDGASGSITGADIGVDIVGAGTVVNSGRIASVAPGGRGVAVALAGSVANAASGSITGSAYGVEIIGAGVVVNDGGIAGTGAASFGVDLSGGGSVGNGPSASIAGGRYGVYISGAAGTVVNSGSLVGTSISGVFLRTGGAITNAVSGMIAGLDGAFLVAGTVAATMVNYGRIASDGTRGAGVVMSDGGTISNAASGTITGSYGIEVQTPGSVINDGSIAGGGVVGVFLNAGGYVGNGASGSIGGSAGGVVLSGPGTVVNAGSITGTGANSVASGVYLAQGGSVINAAGASIAGSAFGVDLGDGGTLRNAGTIASMIANNGTAVVFGGTGANRLVLEPGFGFSGKVVGSSNAGNTMELASAATVGTVDGLGTNFENFYLIDFDAGARWSIAGGTAAFAGGEVISGFTSGDTIDLVGVGETIGGLASGTLSLTGSAELDLLLPGSLSTQQVRATPSADGTDLTVACFAAGTRILTDLGEQEVQRLRPGARVVSLLHRQLLEVVWIGHRHLRAATREQWPVRVCAGAFAAGVPHQAVRLSPNHAVFVGGVLVPVHHLINGATIMRERCDEVSYYHVELTAHAVLLAEGLPAESYLDTGNRGAFASGGGSPLAVVRSGAIEAADRMGA